MIKGVKPANWGANEVSDLQNGAGNPLYKRVELTWTKPTTWHKADRLPSYDTSEPFLYALIRNHGRFKDSDRIEYIGLTISPDGRFGNHPKAREIVAQHGSVGFSYAPIEVTRGRNKIDRMKTALEEIEHLLIWAVWQNLWNDRKMFTLPGMGSKGGNAWHIINKGHPFSGRMPREIIYPWMLVKPRPHRSTKKVATQTGP